MHVIGMQHPQPLLKGKSWGICAIFPNWGERYEDWNRKMLNWNKGWTWFW